MISPSVSLRDLTPDKFHTVAKIRPVGSLQARRQSTGGLCFYWRYSLGTHSERVAIGIYDASAPPKRLEPSVAGYSLAAATRAAENLALEHYNFRDQGGRPAIVQAKAQEAAALAEVQVRESTVTLKHLLLAYCDHLESMGRTSHRNARSMFRLHVFEAFPVIASRPAASLTAEEFADMMRLLNKAGKGRTANKLRSFARAAYQVGKTARTDPKVPERFKEFRIRDNPVAETSPDSSANKVDKNPLNLKQIRTYWRLIKDAPGFKGALLRLHLLTGGQRIEQLVRLLNADIRKDFIVLYDGKGRPGHPPREHWVPLTKNARAALQECEPQGTFALSNDGGKTHVANTTLSNWAKEIARPKLPEFEAKRVRSGVATVLAEANVPVEPRDRLQSHGISGVQSRHYNGHDYLETKREALETLYKLLAGTDPSRRNRV